ncbi:hypothetical protein C8Q75DRAFT_805459 [Abortiporus biennis]|nr:hypothetical protein C8Q75DRAFT_805459 [Abortiporus biennis]
MSSLSPAVGHDDHKIPDVVSTDKALKAEHPRKSNCGHIAASSVHTITSSTPLQSTSASYFDDCIPPFTSVAKYCNAQRQEKRYEPLCNILNTIIDIAFHEKLHLKLPLPPLGKISFYHNDPNVVLQDNGQDSCGRPNIVAISQPTFEKYTKIHHEEFRISQEIKFLERDIAERASQISKLQTDKSGWTFGEDGNPVNHRIARLRQISSDAIEKRRKLMSVLLEFRRAHCVSTQSDQHTSEDRGLAMTQISWYEMLGPIEVKDTKPLHVLQAALAMWNSIVETRDVFPPSKIPVLGISAPSFKYVSSSLRCILYRPYYSRKMFSKAGAKRPLEEEAHSDQPRYGPRPKHYSSGAPLGGSLPSSQNPIRAEEQAASYALELLAGTNGIRSHCICILVDGEEVQSCYYDASGIIRSYAFNWFQNFEHFAAIIVALGCLDLAG